jgi:phospholipid transport system substrate-binding protein
MIRVAVALALTALFCLSSPLSLRAGEVTEKIRDAIEQGIQIVRDPKYQDGEMRDERIGQLRNVVYPLFDFPEMAKRSLGRHWRRRSQVEREEFIGLFTELLEKNYAGKIVNYSGEKIIFTRETVEEYYAQVDSKLIGKKEQEYSVKYKLWRVDEGWKIYDVVVENISLVNNYRAQFNRIIRQSSYEDLIKRIEQKSN